MLCFTFTSYEVSSNRTHHQHSQLPILLSKVALDDHLGDFVGHHGHIQLLLWDILDPLDYNAKTIEKS